MNASIVRWSKTHTLITTLVLVGLLVGLLVWRTVLHTVAQGTAPCPSGYIIGVAGGSQVPTTPIGGTVPLLFGAPTQTNNISAVRVDFYSNTAGFLGSAVKTSSATNGTYWSLPLYSQLLPNAQHIMYANVGMSDGNNCNSLQIPVLINNPTQLPLRLESNPPNFTGPTNTVINLAANVSVNGASVLPYASISWGTTVGNIEKLPGIAGAARLFTGPQTANGKVTITAKYGGKTVALPVPVSVLGSDVPAGTAPTDTTTSTVSAGTAGSTAATTPEQQAKLATSVQDCATSVLGAKRAAEIKAGTVRPSAADLEKLKPCFAQTNYVVPNTFAPVEPAKVKELARSSTAKILDLSNIKTDSQKDALRITGKSEPNSAIMVYVFSEPLVITTSTDADGNWSYTLEDPLEPGNHEVYAVVDKGDGEYQKTDPFSFVIGRASASAENPSGLSLKLENDSTPIQSNRNLYIYFAVFVALIVGGLLFTLWLFKRWSKHNQLPPPAPTITMTPSGPPTMPNYPV